MIELHADIAPFYWNNSNIKSGDAFQAKVKDSSSEVSMHSDK